MIANTSKATAWKAKALLDESIKPPSTSDNNLNRGINYVKNPKIQVKIDKKLFKAK